MDTQTPADVERVAAGLVEAGVCPHMTAARLLAELFREKDPDAFATFLQAAGMTDAQLDDLQKEATAAGRDVLDLLRGDAERERAVTAEAGRDLLLRLDGAGDIGLHMRHDLTPAERDTAAELVSAGYARIDTEVLRLAIDLTVPANLGTTPTMARPGWTSTDDDGVRIRHDGADETLVVLWSSGYTTAGTIRDLCARLALQLDHEPADRDRIERAYWRWTPDEPGPGPALMVASLATEVEVDGEVTVVVWCHEPEAERSDAITVGAYLDPEARYEPPF